MPSNVSFWDVAFERWIAVQRKRHNVLAGNSSVTASALGPLFVRERTQRLCRRGSGFERASQSAGAVEPVDLN